MTPYHSSVVVVVVDSIIEYLGQVSSTALLIGAGNGSQICLISRLVCPKLHVGDGA